MSVIPKASDRPKDPFTLVYEEPCNKHLVDKYVPFTFWICGNPVFLDVLEEMTRQIRTITDALFESSIEAWGIEPKTFEERVARDQLRSYHIALKDKAYDLETLPDFIRSTFACDPAVLHSVCTGNKRLKLAK